ncbi:MAG: bifunctional (p)ppGpp synthetase/guanosine-3',5'-bis(diphosphate) 3'-pyrophosphohydrolase, partial [Oligoflexia bacterium]|nr:bifunctional (p)ppGpp synthetase/guanosine-3',5'-bis(diphosphate) 3'-pyrophosphohydrolase [Oligoflexia bacterium]
YGKITPKEVIKIIIPEDENAPKPSLIEEIIQRAAKTVRYGTTAVKIRGVDDILVRYAKCCTPVHGEPIIGFITRGRGITVHRKDCQKVLEIDSERLIEVDWDLKTPSERVVRIKVDAMDIQGLLVKMTKVFAENGSSVVGANIKTTKYNQAICFFEITVKDLEHLNRILRNLRKLDGIIGANRVSMQQQGGRDQ